MPATSDSRAYKQLIQDRYTPDKIRILAEGDSWFNYPRRYFIFGKDANVIDHLADRNNLLIYNTSSNGDEAIDMISGDEKLSLLKRLSHNEFDLLLFSGGGNDIVGRYDFGFFIREKQPGMDWQQCILEHRVEMKLKQIENAYRVLCELTMEYSKNPDIKIVTHTYDFVQPNPTGFELFDIIPVGKSWVYPYLKAKKITDANEQERIINHLLTRFKQRLIEVANDYEVLTVVDTQGLLNSDQWRNEIHPTSEGFGVVADHIYHQAIA
ncbi:peptidase C14 [Vibrio europaeus]|uniref:peptidase C14 n=1 Tax=Vibrio europaeus TaxID=300876 RepID=UPI00233F05D9|nr:peptidase C14 [Vibrio europaeus]MDC5818992.1 peptidase C14 [Vibrio europaeus]MDC5870984.1 peptidase C14 [Vibrio europaeus]